MFFGEEEPLNEHEIAWKSKDWVAVRKLVDQYKIKGSNEFYHILNQINSQKKRLNTDYLDSYNQFTINQALSGHIDCLTHTFYMNLLSGHISDQMHFDYLLHSIRPSKRYGGASTIVDPIDTMVDTVFQKAVARYFKVSDQRAREYLEEDFCEEQKLILKKMLQKTVDAVLVKEACTFAKKPDIAKVLKIVETWSEK